MRLQQRWKKRPFRVIRTVGVYVLQFDSELNTQSCRDSVGRVGGRGKARERGRDNLHGWPLVQIREFRFFFFCCLRDRIFPQTNTHIIGHFLQLTAVAATILLRAKRNRLDGSKFPPYWRPLYHSLLLLFLIGWEGRICLSHLINPLSQGCQVGRYRNDPGSNRLHDIAVTRAHSQSTVLISWLTKDVEWVITHLFPSFLGLEVSQASAMPLGSLPAVLLFTVTVISAPQYGEWRCSLICPLLNFHFTPFFIKSDWSK